MKKFNLIAIALLLVSSVAVAQNKAPIKTPVVKVEQAAVDTITVKEAVTPEPKPETRIRIEGTWLCDGKYTEKKKRIAETDKDKGTTVEQNKVSMIEYKNCNNEVGAPTHEQIEALDVTQSNKEFFKPGSSCRKPNLPVVNNYFGGLAEKGGKEGINKKCVRKTTDLARFEQDANNLPEKFNWSLNADGSIQTDEQKKLDEVNPDAVIRKCTYNCVLQSWSLDALLPNEEPTEQKN